jgi:hypothetical protein
MRNENSWSEGILYVCCEIPFNSKHSLVANIIKDYKNIMFHNNFFMFTIGRIVQHIWVDSMFNFSILKEKTELSISELF